MPLRFLRSGKGFISRLSGGSDLGVWAVDRSFEVCFLLFKIATSEL